MDQVACDVMQPFTVGSPGIGSAEFGEAGSGSENDVLTPAECSRVCIAHERSPATHTIECCVIAFDTRGARPSDQAGLLWRTRADATSRNS